MDLQTVLRLLKTIRNFDVELNAFGILQRKLCFKSDVFGYYVGKEWGCDG